MHKIDPINVTVIGSLAVDMVVRLDDFPLPGQTIMAKSLDYFFGGKGANQAVAAARLGAKVKMIGKLGNDTHGARYRELLQSEGIDTSHLFTSADATGLAQIMINRAGENQICVIPAANHTFDLSDVAAIEEDLTEGSMVIMQHELHRDITQTLIRLCHEKKVRLILNPAPAYPIAEELLPMIDILTPNETELSVLTALPTETEAQVYAAARHLRDLGVRTVVTTIGSRGAVIADENGIRTVAGFPVKPVDTVAAGDSFNGALAYELSRGTSIDTAVRYANAVGAITVTGVGAIPSLPTADQLKAFLAERGIDI
ncbi:MAG: ribokinase [Clostridia bacterium]|nr:ribokinase [Clostridia bacterium]